MFYRSETGKWSQFSPVLRIEKLIFPIYHNQAFLISIIVTLPQQTFPGLLLLNICSISTDNKLVLFINFNREEKHEQGWSIL